MDINAISQLITSMGFPVAMCLILFKQNDTYRNEMAEIIRNNTEAITRMTEKLDTLIGKTSE